MTSIKLELHPTIREIPADLETPVSAFIKLKAHGARFLLESVETGESVGRFSFIGLDALKKIQLVGDEIVVEEEGTSQTIPLEGKNPLDILRDLMSPLTLHTRDHTLPGLLGGAVGYIGYDFVRRLEKLPATLQDPIALPAMNLFLTGSLVIFDHAKRKMLLVTVQQDEPEARLEEIQEWIREPLPKEWTHPRPAKERANFTANYTEEEFSAAVCKAKDYIRSGDVYQVVLSQCTRGEIDVEPFQIYRALRILNPSPYMYYLDFEDHQLVGSSPEVHCKLTGDQALLRPIAGTRPRGATREQDRSLQKELLADEKERAEHLMLVDLARNDLGRCCQYGSIRCSDLFSVEHYSHVMHIVSQVTGTLDRKEDQFSLLAKSFPAGTVSGAPKIRAMEVIEELEKHRRGPYSGTVGYFSLSGNMDMCINIRTIVVKGTTAHLQAGAGIVADSDPAKEWIETQNKMAALKQAIVQAEEGF